MTLILRQDLNRKLSTTELDDNFQYLEQLAISGTSSGGSGATGPAGPTGPAGGSSATFSLLSTIDYTDLNAGTVSSVIVSVVGGKPENKFIEKSIFEIETPFVSASSSNVGTIQITVDNGGWSDSILLTMAYLGGSVVSATGSFVGMGGPVSQSSNETNVDVTFSAFTGGTNTNDWTSGSAKLWVLYADIDI
jgi:hypothetical protein